MYLMYKKNICFEISKNNYKVDESESVEVTEKINCRSCQLINYDINLIKTRSYENKFNVLDILSVLQNYMMNDEKVLIYIEEFYRSIESEEKLIFSPYILSYYECKKEELCSYNKICRDNFILDIFQDLNIIRNTYNLQVKKFMSSENLPIIFMGKAAALVSHEVLGHLLEIDNFYFYKYSRYISLINKLNVDIEDNPFLIKELGLCRNDEMLNKSYKTIVFKHGIFTGDLIGGNINSRICNRNLRRSRLIDSALPRMSTLCVNVNTLNKQRLEYVEFGYDLILIKNVRKAFLDHKNNCIVLMVADAVEQKEGESIFRYENFQLKFELNEFLNRINPIKLEKPRKYTINCYKKGQLLQTGVQSIDWILKN